MTAAMAQCRRHAEIMRRLRHINTVSDGFKLMLIKVLLIALFSMKLARLRRYVVAACSIM